MDLSIYLSIYLPIYLSIPETDDSMIDVTVCPPKGDPVKLLPDEEGFMMYESRVEIPGQSAQAHLGLVDR